MEKMTNVKALETVIAFATENADVFAPEVVEKITKIRDSYVSKSENRKPTKAQEEGAEIRATIKATLEDADKAFTATEILNAISGEYAGITLPRVTAQLTKLVKENVVERFLDKKTAYFKAIKA